MSKKRNSVSEEHENTDDSQKPINKKLKSTDAPAVEPSTKPMESKKKRKALDKERRRSEAEAEAEGKPKPEPEPEPAALEPKPAAQSADSTSSGGGGSLPEFHIGVFKDLAVASESVREAAVKQMVTELKAVQNAYDGLQEKEIGDGGLKLEAEKDDGLDECAPSVRYAVRRLIRGVSSSREVCVLCGSHIAMLVLFLFLFFHSNLISQYYFLPKLLLDCCFVHVWIHFCLSQK